jgi:hypothetical protein
MTSQVIATAPARADPDPMTNLMDTTEETTDTLEATAERWMATWNEPDPDRRRQLAAVVFAGDGAHYSDPFIEAAGADAIADAVGALVAGFPGHHVERTSAVDRHHGYFRFAWKLVGPAGEVVTVGLDAGTFDAGGRFGIVAGFAGELT